MTVASELLLADAAAELELEVETEEAAACIAAAAVAEGGIAEVVEDDAWGFRMDLVAGPGAAAAVEEGSGRWVAAGHNLGQFVMGEEELPFADMGVEIAVEPKGKNRLDVELSLFPVAGLQERLLERSWVAEAGNELAGGTLWCDPSRYLGA